MTSGARLPAADAVGGDGTLRVGAKQIMPRLGTEMRHIDKRHMVCRPHVQDLPGRHCQQPFARTQDGQGAQQAFAIEFGIHVSTHHAKCGLTQQKRDAVSRDRT
jgi:hypothetical protein